MNLNPKVWGPHYWFFLHTICLNYPIHPNKMIKQKTYDFIMNFPLFIPNKEIADSFEQLIDKYPVTPYLDSRGAFIKWIHFIHNEINRHTNKPFIKINNFIDNYYALYQHNNQPITFYKQYSYLIKIVFYVILIVLIRYLYTL